ncbi:hypothetical protein HanXRQr2_Chr16g0743151 [Helianthus annuus]|uniref:Uncharacterized protein n=1 Tax=Helianthus annuus TaxID=4232 RepID=A0A9K3GXU2_HELAN|nr:hypothetical protein HanXRQr2_Chr16g0743151 [Helianthus annuus]KAJ0820828.1 hypothetical protein HanPSC8_Chr16g0712661 [Helianthus annuus]
MAAAPPYATAPFSGTTRTAAEPRRQWWCLLLCSASDVSGLVWFKPRVRFQFYFGSCYVWSGQGGQRSEFRSDSGQLW